jgi:flagellar protein FlaI
MLFAQLLFRKLVRGYRAISKENKGLASLASLPSLPTSIPSFAQPGVITAQIGQINADTIIIKKEEAKPIEIPTFKPKEIGRMWLEEKEHDTSLCIQYPLIPNKPAKNEPVFSYAKIEWSPQKQSYEYKVIEPELTPNIKRVFIRIKTLLEEKLDVDLSKLKTNEAKDYLHEQTSQLLDYFRINLTESEKMIINYYINRDFLGLGIMEPLMHDSEIEDVSCDGIGIPIYVFHRDSLLGSIPTNIVFNSGEELDSYLIRLAQLCGQAVSVIDPLLDGTLPDGSRLQGTLATDIARKGSNFTIRKFTEYPFSPTDLLNFGTVDVKTLAFLWYAIDNGCSVLLSGGTATGKTVLLNVLSLFIKPEMKIVSIEDTAELKLPHPHWIPQVARVSIATEAGKARGEVDLFDLLKESLRQRPDYIIVGEVRGKEAYVLFQQMATGHPSLSTIHADSIEKLNNRLTTPPISLPPSLLENLDIVVFLTMMRYRGKHVRKVRSVSEVIGFDLKEKQIKSNEVFEWDPSTDKIVTRNKSYTLWKIMKKRGLTEKEITEELKRRMAILLWLQEQDIKDYRDVGRIISLYYDFPEKVLELVRG